MRIRSFVIRQGRITKGQKRALIELAPVYLLDFASDNSFCLPEDFLLFDRKIIEIGFGDGESLVQMAINNPEIGFLGIEVHLAGIGRAMHLANQHGLTNLKIINFDAMEVLRQLPAIFDQVQVYFPDPWQKARHHKRRLINQEFLTIVGGVLKEKGELHLATDWEDYAFFMLDNLKNHDNWHNLGDLDGFWHNNNWRLPSKFEQKGIAKGHSVWDLRYQWGK